LNVIIAESRLIQDWIVTQIKEDNQRMIMEKILWLWKRYYINL